MDQIISSSFTARTLGIPYLGIFGACSSSMEGLSLAAQLIESKAAKYVIAAASSHNAAAEKQFRYPTDYGVTKATYCSMDSNWSWSCSPWTKWRWT